MVGVSTVLGNDLVTMALYVIAALSGWVGPLLTPKIGQRGISIAGFAIVLASLLIAAWALYAGHTMVLPFAAAAMLWGHYWGCVELHDDPHPRRQARIPGDSERLRLRVRQAAIIPRNISVPRPVRRGGSSQRDAVRRDLPADRIAGRDLHTSGSLRL